MLECGLVRGKTVFCSSFRGPIWEHKQETAAVKFDLTEFKRQVDDLSQGGWANASVEDLIKSKDLCGLDVYDASFLIEDAIDTPPAEGGFEADNILSLEVYKLNEYLSILPDMRMREAA